MNFEILFMGKLINKIRHFKAKLISLFEIVIGAILLIREVRDFTVLPTIAEADKMFGGIIDFVKYKENTYSLLYLWTLLLATGISYWISKKSHWIFTQILLITLFFMIEFMLIGFLITDFNITILLLSVLLLLLFIWFEIKTNKHSYLNEMRINNKVKYTSMVLGFFSCVIYISIL